MSDSLEQLDPHAAQPRANASARKGRSAILVGVTISLVSGTLLLLPHFLPLGGLAKYVVAIAILGACLGLAITLNGAIDRWRGQR